MLTVEEIADKLQAAGIDSPFSTDYEAVASWQKTNPGKPINYDEHRQVDRLHLPADDLPKGWRLAVANILNSRHIAKLEADSAELFGKLPEPLRTVALMHRRNLTFMPQSNDLSYLLSLRNRNGDRVSSVYKPDPRCTLRMKLSQAVRIDYEEASYATHSRYVIPVEGERPADLEPCRGNLTGFCEAIRTHDGFAGSGCSWTMSLIDTGNGFVVYADCRASISD